MDFVVATFHLPPKNVFIATDFALRRESTKGGDDNNGSIWREVTESVTADPEHRGQPPPAVALIRHDEQAEVWFKRFYSTITLVPIKRFITSCTVSFIPIGWIAIIRHVANDVYIVNSTKTLTNNIVLPSYGDF